MARKPVSVSAKKLAKKPAKAKAPPPPITTSTNFARIGRHLRYTLAELERAKRAVNAQLRIDYEDAAGRHFMQLLKLAGVKTTDLA